AVEIGEGQQHAVASDRRRSVVPHGRACPGHPRLSTRCNKKTWMPGSRPGMTTVLDVAAPNPATFAAMPRPPKPHAISKLDARRIWLGAQRLDVSAPFGEGVQAVADAVAHLGYVQIDTINVIERCHHHILYTRIPAYRRADLRQAQTTDKSVF